MTDRAPRDHAAIIGMACRYAGAPDLGAFWDLLVSGHESVTDYTPGRTAELDAFYGAAGSDLGAPSRRGGFIENIDQFDADFFGISPREAEFMDPQQRLLLELGWEALEDAGQPIERLAGPHTGVFVGAWTSDYGRYVDAHLAVADVRSSVCNGLFGSAGRIAFAFGFRGPEVSINAGCASSLAAIHHAIAALRSGSCAVALVGGVNAVIRPEITQAFDQAGALSPEGRCKFGDAGADGFVRSDGAGVLILKRLSQALTDGDRIRAVIRGSAINSSGSSSGFLMRPSKVGQCEVILAALADAAVSPATVQYVEAHGTGTATGDPIELSALAASVGCHPDRTEPCLIGSVKSNIGHTEAAAGIAGVIKVALALEHRYLPETLHVEKPNPAIDWQEAGIVLNTAGRPWPKATPRRAGVSAFGLTGTNAHVILEEAPVPESAPVSSTRDAWALPLSAQSAEALQLLAAACADVLENRTDLDDLGYTAATRRSALPHRLVVTGSNAAELANRLKNWSEDGSDPFVGSGVARDANQGIALVFPGQGSQWAGMGRRLMACEPAFRAAIMRCDAAIRNETGWSVEELLAADAGWESAGIERIQPALFSVQIALAELWASWGVKPAVVVGHSMGEVAAAHVAGALSLDDAAAIICRRSALMTRFTGQGAMAMVELSAADAAVALRGYEDRLSVAVSNGPRATVLAGEPHALRRVVQNLEDDGIFCRPVAVQVAAHSPQMDLIRDELLGRLQDLRPRAGHTPIFSTTLGRLVDGAGFDAGYWVDNLRRPVLFHSAVTALMADGLRVFIEASPHPVLLPAIDESASEIGVEVSTLASMRRQEPEQATMLAAFGRMFVQGLTVDWSSLYPAGRMVDFPGHPWRRRRYWPDGKSALQISSTSGGHPLLPVLFRTADPSWIWTVRIDTETLPWLKDHAVRGSALLPASAYVEMAVMAARQIFGHARVGIEALLLKEAIVLPPLQEQQVQLVANVERPGRWSIRFHVRDEAAQGWAVAASCVVVETAEETAPPLPPGRMAAFAPGAAAVYGSEHAARLEQLGYEFGPNFLNLRWLDFDGSSVRAEAVVGDELRTAAYGLHPALLDAGLQALAAGFLQRGSGRTQLIPQLVGQARIFPAAASARAAFIVADIPPGDDLVGDVRLFGADGTPLAEVLDLRFQAFGATETHAGASPLYDLDWVVAESAPIPAEASGGWLVLSDEQGFGEAFASAMRLHGVQVDVVVPRDRADPFGRRVAALEAGLEAGLDSSTGLDIVHFGTLNLADDAPADRVADNAADIAALATLASESGGARLCLVTRGACAVRPSERVSVSQASIWGLGATIANELPELGCRLIDLDRAGGPSTAMDLAGEVLRGRAEPRVALRGGERRVARLRARGDTGPSARTRPLEHGERAELTTAATGVLEGFSSTRALRRAPGAGEVEIEVHAAGLNFRDVLRVMGLFDPTLGQAHRLGAECAGRVVRVGAGVCGIEVGDRVVALSPAFQDVGTLASHLVTRAVLTAKVPDDLDLTAAAGLPCVYLTSYFALAEAARMRPGETVLIHSATGGVGLSAIEVARWLGARIIASAGTEAKRALLRDMGIEGVFDSRSTGFGRIVAELTGGRGADVILNALSGSAIPEGLAALAPYGRFLELGKRDMWDNNRIGLGALLQNRAIYGIDLAAMTEDQPERVGALLQKVMALVGEGVFAPLPVTVFPASRAAEGFQLMAAARHIGKVVIATDEMDVAVEPAPIQVRADGTYLITGGLGALGLVAAEGLHERGARSLVLCSRAQPSDQALQVIGRLRGRGATVVARSLDIADEAQLRGLFDDIAVSLPPLRGVVHAAGLLDDALMDQLSADRFRTVMRGKVEGAILLDRLTEDLPLDFFVLFSSVAALLGSPGQGNYAAANAMLDALAADRSARGLPAVSIAWGPWTEIGLAAAQANRGARIAAQGLGALSPDEGRDLLLRLLGGGAPYVAAMHFDASRWLTVAASSATALFGDLPTGTSEGAFGDAGSPAGRDFTGIEGRHALKALVVGQLAAVLRMPPDRLVADRPFRSLGLDSLMGIELRNRLQRALGLKLSASTVWNFATINQLCAHLASRIEESSPSSTPHSVGTDARQSADRALEAELLQAEALLAEL